MATPGAPCSDMSSHAAAARLLHEDAVSKRRSGPGAVASQKTCCEWIPRRSSGEAARKCHLICRVGTADLNVRVMAFAPVSRTLCSATLSITEAQSQNPRRHPAVRRFPHHPSARRARFSWRMMEGISTSSRGRSSQDTLQLRHLPGLLPPLAPRVVTSLVEAVAALYSRAFDQCCPLTSRCRSSAVAFS